MTHDELASRRKAAEVPSPTPPDLDVDEAIAGDSGFVADHASAPELLDAQAQERDERAFARDEAGEKRDRIAGTYEDSVGLIRSFAARDRAAASFDRAEAALDRHRAREYLRRTYRDELTGALQRPAGRDMLSHEVDRATRTGEPLLIAFLDVMNLKAVNDAHGHAAGDELLQAVGHALCNGLRSYDVVVRYGGDEFVCGLPNARLADARKRFTDVAQLLVDRFPNGCLRIGVAEFSPGETLDELIARADRELYAGQAILGAHHNGPISGGTNPSGTA
jgi:diguanylate cyclase (GGDEF)-like protein